MIITAKQDSIPVRCIPPGGAVGRGVVQGEGGAVQGGGGAVQGGGGVVQKGVVPSRRERVLSRVGAVQQGEGAL